MRPHVHELLVKNLTKAIRDPDLVLTVRYIAEYKGAVETDLGVIHLAIGMHIVEVYKIRGKLGFPLAVDFSFK
jgi:hypothetical protein